MKKVFRRLPFVFFFEKIAILLHYLILLMLDGASMQNNNIVSSFIHDVEALRAA